MNKKLIIVGIAAALAAPLAAQAGVEVYGDARLSLDFVNNNDNSTAATKAAACGAGGSDTCKDNTISLTSNYSYIGFKGDEDLGGGMSALWQIEQEVQFDTGTWGSAARDTYVGLGAGWGNVLAGHMRTPYRVATEQLDPFANTRADYNAIIGSFDGSQLFNDETRASNMIAYTSPDMGGFKGALAYILSDATTGNDNLPKTSSADKRYAYSLSLAYNNGPIFASAAYETLVKSGVNQALAPTDPTAKDTTAWKIGGGYTLMDALTIGALYENVDVGGSVGDRNAWSVDASYKMGATTLMAAVNGADKTKVAKTGAMQYSIGVKQGLSKNTEVYALYTQVSNDNNASYGLDASSSAVVLGQDMSAFSLGINHMFSSK